MVIKSKAFNYQPIFDQLTTIKLYTQFRIFLTQYYKTNLQGFELPAIKLQINNQENFLDLFNLINFSHNATHQSFQLIMSQTQNLKFYMMQDDFAKSEGFFSRFQVIDKNFNAHLDNMICEYDVIMLKQKIDEEFESLIWSHMTNFWISLKTFWSLHNIVNVDPYYEGLLSRERPFWFDSTKLKKQANFFIKSEHELFMSAVSTYKLVLFQGINRYNNKMCQVHDPSKKTGFWTLFYLDSEFQVRPLMTILFDKVDHAKFKSTKIISICINFSNSFSLISLKKSVQEINFIYQQ